MIEQKTTKLKATTVNVHLNPQEHQRVADKQKELWNPSTGKSPSKEYIIRTYASEIFNNQKQD